MWFLYDLAIQFYGGAIRFASLFNAKARKWVAGRRSAVSGQRALEHFLLPTADRRPPTVIWFHCASLGEFEQGRPVIEAFRRDYPGWKIVLTFFSPSGYEIRKNYEGADLILYLPLDTPGNAKRFIDVVQPSLVVFVKYEYWFRYLDVLYQRKIPLFIVSAIFRPDQHFFRWYGSWMLKQLKKVTGFFVQDEASAKLLRAKGLGQVTISGDTRFDRVAAIAKSAKPFPLVEKFAGGDPVFLAGSTWPADEELILNLIGEIGNRVKFIIAPHEVGRERIEKLKSSVVSRQSFIPHPLAPSPERRGGKGGRGDKAVRSGTRNPEPGTVLFSALNQDNAQTARVIIVDGIGYLSHLYQYATVAYIGGGFGVGIHNILEAATFGKPVIFGPNYTKFREAVELIEEGGAFTITDFQQLNNRTIELLNNPELLQKASAICSGYVQKKKGATETIISFLKSCQSK